MSPAGPSVEHPPFPQLLALSWEVVEPLGPETWGGVGVETGFEGYSLIQLQILFVAS